ncbi:MAG: hypothetical protein HY317_02615 [Acidobacteria bacterium]|nr:hypothetical protein [Acidobacteriota bacterium]
MNADLEKLVRLQRAESELHRLTADLSQIPRLREQIDARRLEERSRLDVAREALAASQKNRRQRETELQDLETKRSKYKGQLMEVKTNKEYTAMLHEIEVVEREIRSREDQVLEEMERAETLAADIKREEAAFKEAEEQFRGEARGLDERAKALAAAAARQAAEREAVAATVPSDLLERFQRVARLRGSGVAQAKDGMCTLCHVRLRLQMYSDLKRNEQILECPACSRILYYEPPPPVVSPEP